MKRLNWKFWLSCVVAYVALRLIVTTLSGGWEAKSSTARRSTPDAAITAPAPAPVSPAPSAPQAPAQRFDPSTATLEPSPASPPAQPTPATLPADVDAWFRRPAAPPKPSSLDQR